MNRRSFFKGLFCSAVASVALRGVSPEAPKITEVAHTLIDTVDFYESEFGMVSISHHQYTNRASYELERLAQRTREDFELSFFWNKQ